MEDAIKSIVCWNTIADNNSFNYHLESSMLSEEFAETIIALKSGDKVEAIDGILDMFIIGVGTLHKLGVSPNQMNEAFKLIMENNYSKFHGGKCIKNSSGKIIKPEGFVPVDLSTLFK